MITLLHGENIAESRKAYADTKTKTPSHVTLDGQTITISQLSQHLESSELFGDTPVVFIEELYSKKKGNKDIEAVTSYIASHEKDNTIVIWESKQLTPKQAGVFKQAIVKKFDLPQVLFAFLDSIQPGNGKKSVELFHKVLETSEAELVFFMIVRQVRILLSMIEESDEQIDEVKRLAPWQKGKLAKQASAFGKDKLLAFYFDLYKVEKDQKIGNLLLPLGKTIDFLLINL